MGVLQGAEALAGRHWGGPRATELGRRILGAMAVVVEGCSFASISVMGDLARRDLNVVNSARVHSAVRNVDPALGARLGELVRGHAGYCRMQDRVMAGEVVADVDVMSRREVTGSGPFRDCYAPRDAGFHAAFTLPGPVVPYWVGVFRRDEPIGGREVGMVRLLRDQMMRWPGEMRRVEAAELEEGWREARLGRLGLSRAEAEVLRWVCEGKRNGEIAVILGKSERTVHAQMRGIFVRLGVESRLEAARVGMEAMGR